jgi:hypothetical protein
MKLSHDGEAGSFDGKSMSSNKQSIVSSEGQFVNQLGASKNRQNKLKQQRLKGELQMALGQPAHHEDSKSNEDSQIVGRKAHVKYPRTVVSLGSKSRTNSSFSQNSYGSSQEGKESQDGAGGAAAPRRLKIPHIKKGHTRPLFDHFEEHMNNIDEEEMNSSGQDSSEEDVARRQYKRRQSMDVSLNEHKKEEMTRHFESINELVDKEEDSGPE